MKIKDVFRAIVLVVVAALAVSIPADANTCDLTELPPTGTLTATMLNQRYRQVENCLNGNLGNSNWFNGGDKLTTTNIASPNAIYAVSWTIDDEDSDATAGEDVSAGTNVRNWRAFTAGNVVGVSVALRCTAANCAAANPTITLQADAGTLKTFSGLVWTNNVPQVDFTLASAITSANVLNIDLAGTLTNVDFIDIVVYFKSLHQS